MSILNVDDSKTCIQEAKELSAMLQGLISKLNT
ncbi:MAG: hypothetical protein ACK5LK_11975 [Chthoniobacterales bacterium]